MAGGGGKRGRRTGSAGWFITKGTKGTKNTKEACPSRRDIQGRESRFAGTATASLCPL